MNHEQEKRQEQQKTALFIIGFIIMVLLLVFVLSDKGRSFQIAEKGKDMSGYPRYLIFMDTGDIRVCTGDNYFFNLEKFQCKTVGSFH